MENTVSELLKEYQALQAKAENERAARILGAHQAIPKLKEIDDTINKLGLECTSYSLGLDAQSQHEYLQALAEKIQLLKEEKLVLLKKHGYPPDHLDLMYICQNCKDTGYIGHKKCACFNQKLISRAYRQSNLGSVLSRENFNTFDMDKFSNTKYEDYPKTPKQNMLDILSRCEGFVHNFENDTGENLLFYGSTGLGKTFLCNCIAKKLLDKGKLVLYLTSFKLFKILEEFRFRRSDASIVQNQLDYILTCDLLIIDDLGTELANSFTTSELFNIINSRLLERKKTIISTNLQPEELIETYGQRVFSRISAHYTALEFYGHDLRM